MRPKSGGAERVAANLAQAFSLLYGPDSVAVLVTDWSGLAFPENVFASYPRGVPIIKVVALSRASFHERTWDLMTALMSMRPEMVINVNSQAMWECYERFGPELSAHVRLGKVAFGHAVDKGGKPIGYTATHLERLLPFLDFVIAVGTRRVGCRLIALAMKSPLRYEAAGLHDRAFPQTERASGHVVSF